MEVHGDPDNPHYNNTRKAPIASPLSAMHPQLWAELHIHVLVPMQEHIITQYGSTVYIGMALVLAYILGNLDDHFQFVVYGN